jgi:murein DD-endopeptidase MepM/ murein hydrolase activator NlpD
MHQGVDFGARYGTAIRAVADGRVISAGYGGGYGNRVILDHGGGTMTLYGHCSRLTVQVGQTVRQGQLLGAVGASGLATGPHLHFEVWRNGQRVNPLGFL